jgi:glutamate dehydrogenase
MNNVSTAVRAAIGIRNGCCSIGIHRNVSQDVAKVRSSSYVTAKRFTIQNQMTLLNLNYSKCSGKEGFRCISSTTSVLNSDARTTVKDDKKNVTKPSVPDELDTINSHIHFDSTQTSTNATTPFIPGVHHMYGSLHDASNGSKFNSSNDDSYHHRLMTGKTFGGKPVVDNFIDNGAVSANSSASWQPADNANVQRVTVKAMIYELIHQQTATIEQTVPWFLDTMPASYFRQVPEWLRMEHIKAIAAVKDANMDLYLNLSTHLQDGRQVLTFIRPGTEAGTLLKMVQELPENTKYDESTPLSRLHVFSTSDESMSLNMFVYGRSNKTSYTSTEYIRDVGLPILKYATDLQDGILHNDNISDVDQLKHNETLFNTKSLEDYMKQCTETYIRIGADDPKRFLQQVQLIDHVSGTDGTAVHIAASVREPGYYWVDFAVANSLPQVALENLCRLLYVHQFDVARARLDIIPDLKANDGSNVIMLRTLVQSVAGTQSDTPETFQLLAHELKRSKWLDPHTHDLVFMQYPELGVTRGEIITGLCHVIHPVLAKTNPFAYSSTNIFETISNPRFIGHASTIADLFLDRFHPKRPLQDDIFTQRCNELIQTIDDDVEDRVASEILLKMIDIVQNTLKTNIYMPERYALGLRLNPKCMTNIDDIAAKKELPYGVLFIHGRRFNGFHVRFRDISRGGLRLVTPSSAEQFALESTRHYDECYGLAYAQQLKNKDIPEGGSKAVNLINTTGLSEKAKNFVMRKSVKSMTDTILDLIVDTPYTKQYMVDLFGKPEVLYLGPDEQVIPDDIEWIVKRAAERGYTTPAAFMSSKPKAGYVYKKF